MKRRRALGCVVALVLGVSGVAHAAGDYFPPERLHCTMDSLRKVTCEGFSKQYLVEDTYTVNFPVGKDVSLMFASGVAYFTPDEKEMSVFFTYKDGQNKTIKLKTVNTSIRPDLKNGAWKRFKDEFYTCDSGYMNCPITDLPEIRS